MLRLLNRAFVTLPKTAFSTTSQRRPFKDSLFVKFHQYLKNENLVVGPNLLSNFQLIQKMSPEGNKKKDFDKMLRKIDKESMNNLDTARNEISALIDQLIDISPSSVHTLETFNEALIIFRSQFDAKPSRENFVKLCFYYGIYKKRPPGPERLKEIIRAHLDKYIDDLSVVDFAIVCTAAFKASIKISSGKFRQRLTHEITSIQQVDSFLFVCFIKSLRQNLLCPPEVIEKIRQLNKAGKLKALDNIVIGHVLPIIANNGLIEPEITKTLVDQFFQTVDPSVCRVKDIQKFIFSCAYMNHRLELRQFKILEELLISKTNTEEFHERFDSFVDAALSLWMLNYRSIAIIDKLLSDQRLQQQGDKSRIKIDSRKLLLMTCLEIEEPKWITKASADSFNANRAAPKYLVKPSLEAAKQQITGRDAKFVQQIKHLNIAGILARAANGDEIHFEVLDETNTLRDGTSPNGIFALKLRLLKHLNCKVKTVRKT